MILDASALKARRRDLGYTVRGIASDINVPLTTITRLEDTGDARSLNTATVMRYLEALALSLNDVFGSETEQPADEPDDLDKAVVSLLHELGRGVQPLEIAKIMRRPVEDVRESLSRIGAQLPTVGLRLHHTSTGYSIAPAADRNLGKQTLPERLRRLASINSTDINLVHQLLHAPAKERKVSKTPNGVTSLGKLLALGIANTENGDVTLSDTAKKSMGID